VERRAVREVRMDFKKLREECVRRGWRLVDERGPDADPVAFRVLFGDVMGVASCYKLVDHWRVGFFGTMTQLHELHDVFLACGAA
jgi:hypothetical protein